MNSGRKQPKRPRAAGTPRTWQQVPADPRPAPADVVRLFGPVTGKLYDGHERNWDRVFAALNLKLCYQPAVAEVLKQGRWRTAKNPRAYVATAAYRLALGMRLLPDRSEGLESPVYVVRENLVGPATVDSLAHGRNRDGDLVDLIEAMSVGSVPPATDPIFYLPFEELKKRHVNWERERSGLVPEPVTAHEPTNAPASIESDGDWDESQVPEWLRAPGDIDWQKVAEVAVPKAHLRRQVVKVLRLRFDERIGRTDAVRREPTQAGKNALLAAWRWVERNWASRIAAVLASSTEQQAREQLYDAPRKSSPRRVGQVKTGDALAAAITRGTTRCLRRDDGPSLVLDWRKNGL